MIKLFNPIMFQIGVTLLLLAVGSVVTASEKFPDRWGLSFAGFRVDSINTSASIGSKDVPLAAKIDLNRNLDIADSDNSFRFDSYYRFTDRHQITFSYYDMRVTAEKY